MSKRLTDTDIWKTQRWFRKLPPLDKLVFCYIKDQCHHSGVWKIDCSDLIEDLGLESFNLNKFIASINTEFDKISGEKTTKERVLIISNNYLWITGFIQFQYENKEGKVSAEAAPVKSALQYLQGIGTLNEGLNKGYIKLTEPLQESLIRTKDKDIVKDKAKVKDRLGVQGEGKIVIKGFNTMPKASDFNGLPAEYIQKSIQLVKLTSQSDITDQMVLQMWDVFKLQELTGEQHYHNEGKVYSHFLNVIKKQKFQNGANKSSAFDSTSKQGTSNARTDALKKW